MMFKLDLDRFEANAFLEFLDDTVVEDEVLGCIILKIYEQLIAHKK